MKISKIETFVVDGGWRAWTYVKVETDEGITGWGECSDTRGPNAVGGAGGARPGGIAARAIAGIECALVDIKARSLGISVTELLGGPTRDRVRLYWSHCGTTRVRHHDIVGKPPIESWSDVPSLAKEVLARGFTALKTNIVMPGKGATWQSGFDGSMGPNDEWAPNWLI